MSRSLPLPRGGTSGRPVSFGAPEPASGVGVVDERGGGRDDEQEQNQQRRCDEHQACGVGLAGGVLVDERDGGQDD